MATSASLIVRISADINDFSRQMRALTKGVDSAARKVNEVGKALSIGLTAPLLATAAAMNKFAIDQEAAGEKLQRQFGGATADIVAKIKAIHAVVPETTTALEAMANQLHQFADGIGMAGPQANLFSGEVLKMAAALQAANPGTTLAETTEALERGFEGQTHGLKDFGIAIDKNQIQQEAYRLGLIKTGQALTPLGTALATYAALLQPVARLTGEAGATQKEAGRQWEFMKRDAIDLAESFGAKLLPAFGAVIAIGRDFLKWINSWSDGMKTTALVVGALAAALGPLMLALVGTAVAIAKVKAAFDILKDVELLQKLGELVGGWKAVAIALAVVAVAVVTIAVAWSYFKEKADEASKSVQQMLGKLAGAKDLLNLGGGAATGIDTGTPLAQFTKQASAITSAYNDAIAMGTHLEEPFQAVVALNQSALDLYGKQADKLNEMAQAARRVAIETRQIALLHDVSEALKGKTPTGNSTYDVIGAAAMNSKQVGLAVASQAVNNENQLRLQEALLQTIDVFDAVRQAAANLGTTYRQVADQFRLSVQMFKQSWSSAGTSAMAGLQAGLSGILDAFTPFALIVEAVGKVMQGLQPVIDDLMGPLVALGQIIGTELMPVLRPLFESLKIFGIATALAAEVVYTAAAGLARLIGNVVVAIGTLIRHIPFLGGVGKAIQNAGNGILDLATSFSNTAKQLDQQRIQLQNMNFDDAANGLSTLTNAATSAAEAISNLPTAFNYQLEKYYATKPIAGVPVITSPAQPPSSSPAPRGPTSGPGSKFGQTMEDSTPVAVIAIDGKKIAQITWGHVRAAASRQYGSPQRVADVAVVG